MTWSMLLRKKPLYWLQTQGIELLPVSEAPDEAPADAPEKK